MADFPDRAAPGLAALDRPRERLLASGPRALSDADLVALLVGTGTGKPRRVHELMRHAAHAEREGFHVVLLDVRGRLLRAVQVAEGSLPQCPVSPRDALRPAVREGAHGIVFCHHHPSGVMWRSASCGPRRGGRRGPAIRPAARSHNAPGGEARS